jgi:hypothetical protein
MELDGDIVVSSGGSNFTSYSSRLKGGSLIPVRLYIALFLAVGGICFVLALAAGQPSGMLLGLFFLGWGTVVWYLRFGRRGTPSHASLAVTGESGYRSNPHRKLPIASERLATPPAERNPALDELKQLPQTAITAGLIAAVPGLATALYVGAKKRNVELGIADASFADCIFDLELVGAFERASIFAGDKNLASLFVDAVVFKATGKSPSAPSHEEINCQKTIEHRGIAKYALAKKHSTTSLPDPGAWLFITEYMQARGDVMNPAYFVAGADSVLPIRRAGEWITERALTGRSPTQEEMDALPKAIDAIGKAELLKAKVQMPQEKPQVVVPTEKQVKESWEAHKKGPEAMLEWVKKNRAEYEAKEQQKKQQ